MNTILKAEEARTLGRPIGKVSAEKITAFITEVEQTIIRKKLGDELFLKLIELNTKETDSEEEISAQNEEADYTVLLNGGRYTDKNGRVRFIAGLKVAESYYVYAQNVRAGDIESTRYGNVHKDGEYSSLISDKERDALANGATEIGDAYMKEVLEYCFDQKFLDPRDSRNGLGLTTGCIIRKIRK